MVIVEIWKYNTVGVRILTKKKLGGHMSFLAIYWNLFNNFYLFLFFINFIVIESLNYTKNNFFRLCLDIVLNNSFFFFVS